MHEFMTGRTRRYMAFKIAVAGACVYEAVAIMSGGRLRTISEIVETKPAFGKLILAGLEAHFMTGLPRDPNRKERNGTTENPGSLHQV